MTDKEEGNSKGKRFDISDYIESIEDKVPNYSPDNRPQTWSRPLGVGVGMRRPSSLRNLANRQNIDYRIFQAVKTQADRIREASLMRTASTIASVQILNGEEAIALRDPYGHLEKLRFENAYRADPTVRRCIDVLAKFVMGKRTHFDIVAGTEEREDHMLIAHGFRPPPSSTGHLPENLQPPSVPGQGGQFNASPVKTAADFVDPSEPGGGSSGMMPDRPSLPDDMIEEMFGNGEDTEEPESPLSEQELRELHRMTSDVIRRIKFHERVKAALTQAYVFGRSALLMETDQQGVPSELKLLNSKKLETVYVDPDSWKMIAVDYADRPKEKPLLAEEIIYFPNQDFHVSPDTLYYGMSRVEPICHVSETNQLLDEIDLKEGARSMWARSGVIKFPPDTPDELVEEFVENFYPGTWNATSQNVQLDVFNLQLDYISLAHVRKENDQRIIRGLGIPSFLVGFENISNRATAESVMISWHESELDAERTWLQDIIEPQFFDYLIGLRFPELLKTKNDPTQIISGAAQPLRIKLDFQNISFEPIQQKAEAIIPLFDRGLCTPEKALEVLRWGDQYEAVIAELQRRELEKQQKFQIDLELKKQRAKSYLLGRTQQSVEQQREEKKVSRPEPEQFTAQAALQNLHALQAAQENASVTKDLELLRMKLLRESHAKDMEIKNAESQVQAKKQQVLTELEEALRRMQSESN